MPPKLLTPEEIAAQAGSSIPRLHLPARADAFGARAARLRALAPGHAMAGYLAFIADLADAQQRALDTTAPAGLPAPEALRVGREAGMPPLAIATHRRDPAWRGALRGLLRPLAARTEGRAHDVVVALERRDDAYLESQADRLLGGITLGLDIAAAPLVAAGLQVYFTGLAIALGADGIPRIDVATLCPCCGSRPTASVLRIGAGETGYRFLHCALCGVEWHMVRVKCSNCESTKGIAYLAIEDGTPPDKAAVRAEACDECGTYLKIVSMERDPNVDPVADDLASVALDLLVAETGKTSSGVNFMLIHGDPGPG